MKSIIFLKILLIFMSFCIVPLRAQNTAAAKADVGIILDLETTFLGKIIKTCVSMALEDFYAEGSNHSTMIVPHFRDSRGEVVAAASAAIDLLKDVEVMAIFGPQRSVEADFVIDIGEKAQVPIISPATSPFLSAQDSSYFIRSAYCSSSQVAAIAALVKAFGWREVAFIYEDTIYGSGLVPFITEGLIKDNVIVSSQSHISRHATDDQIGTELYKLKTMQTRVFVVHMPPVLASHFFLMARNAGMMEKGYAWIIADALTSLLDSVDAETLEAMQGVLGVKAYIPRSRKLENFTTRWRKRFYSENPEVDRSTELNVFGLWAYDSMTALAAGIERVGATQPRFKKPDEGGSLTGLEAIGTSYAGKSLLPLIRNFSSSEGLSGDFRVVDGQLEPLGFEIVNVIGRVDHTVGFWNEKVGISRKVVKTDDIDDNKVVYSTNKDNLGAIVWPGDTNEVPKGWEIPTSGKKLRLGVPVKRGLSEFIKVERDPETNEVKATGFCVDVFEEVMRSLPYAVLYDFIPFETPEGDSAGDYNELVHRIYLGEYDAVVGDVTILANRSQYVDFTFPYTEPGVCTIVPIKDDDRKNAWIFMKPLTISLWLTIGAFFIFTGFIVWVLEHRLNKEFQGSPLQQVGMIFWFSFSTLVFAQKEKVISNLTRFVVIVWVFVVLVLTSSYTANLTSMLTVQQLQPTITDISDLTKKGEYVGYQDGSFIRGFLNNMKFDSTKFRNYSTYQEYDEALSKGSRNGGVAAIVDELPYARPFLSKYCHKYTMVGPIYKTAGFGFAFPKGSPLVPDVSREILNLAESETMLRISKTWFKEEESCPDSNGAVITSESLTLNSFKGLFLIAGVSSLSALVIFLSMFVHEKRTILSSNDPIKQKFLTLARGFYEEKSISSSAKRASRSSPPPSAHSSPERSISYQVEEGMFSQDEGFSTTENASPVHHATGV